jgi:mRNA deadenylase 3'-5' endonuclease subunit Ccr4
MLNYFPEKVVSEEPCENTLKVMTWNILAERLVSHSQFPYAQPQHLDYRYRINITVQACLMQKKFIELTNCSILALQ